MPLISCWECGQPRSSAAAACPHCGAPATSPADRAQVYQEDAPRLLLCTRCHAVGAPERVNSVSGCALLALVGLAVACWLFGWLIFIPLMMVSWFIVATAVVYVIWGFLSTKKYICGECGAPELVPLDSARAKDYVIVVERPVTPVVDEGPLEPTPFWPEGKPPVKALGAFGAVIVVAVVGVAFEAMSSAPTLGRSETFKQTCIEEVRPATTPATFPPLSEIRVIERSDAEVFIAGTFETTSNGRVITQDFQCVVRVFDGGTYMVTESTVSDT